ncbi:MAG: 4-hydroxy-3-methylbut-2-enyl diphosphate reductase [Desulfovibrio sp.]|jgi:4-hydroxy-3-methylbut-2-enyl diphosphate reductase|nr:4-hydroxy-3-methylbut-2-enyl diphosphate reductase [Desulfovibrio sp.]
MRVIRARTAGFCLGVSLALRRLDRELAALDQGAGHRLLTFGPVIHNPLVMRRYADLGVQSVENPAQIRPGDRLVIRAHGLPRLLEEKLAARGAVLVDATCPKVKKAQTAIALQSGEGRALLLFGEREHPEVRGLLSYAARGARAFTRPEEALCLPLGEEEDYCLAAQTTQERSLFEETARLLRGRLGSRLTVLDTICDATRQRQKEALSLAKRVDVVIVVGGRNSGNTRRLAEVVRSRGAEAIHVEQAADLAPAMLRGRSVAGLTAGASTPKSHINEVQKLLEKF